MAIKGSCADCYWVQSRMLKKDPCCLGARHCSREIMRCNHQGEQKHGCRTYLKEMEAGEGRKGGRRRKPGREKGQSCGSHTYGEQPRGRKEIPPETEAAWECDVKEAQSKRVLGSRARSPHLLLLQVCETEGTAHPAARQKSPETLSRWGEDV